MRRFCLSLAALSVATAAQAETIRVEVWYPATSDRAAALQSVQVEPFSGDAGDDLTIQTEDALRGINLGQGPWLRVIPAATGGGGEALLRGAAKTEQRFASFTEERERCVKDDDGKCTSAKEKFVVRCRRRHVDLTVALRLIDRDGTLLWSDNGPQTYEDTHCEDSDATPRTRQAVARNLTARVAWRIRIAFAPRREIGQVRVDENRKGLNKEDSEAFKAAIKWTKEDAEAACQIWGGLADRNPNHVPTHYNLGLCAESGAGTDGSLPQPHYVKALVLNPKHGLARRGLDRIAAQMLSQRQIEAHNTN